MSQRNERCAAESPMPAPRRRRATVIGLVNQYASVILMVIQGFLLVPLYLKHIDVQVYGAWLASGNLLAWLAFIDPGTSLVLQQRVAAAYGRGDRARLGKVIGSGLLINAVTSLVMIAMAAAAAPVVPVLAGVSGPGARDLTIAFAIAGVAEALLLAALAFSSVLLAIMAYPAVTGIAFIAASLIGIGVNIASLLKGFGVISIPLGLLARAIALLSIDALLLRSALHKRLGVRAVIEASEVRSTIKLSSYTWVSRVVGAVLGNIDSVALARYVGAWAVPTYALSRRALDVTGQVAQRLGAAFGPGLAHLCGQGAHDATRVLSERLIRVVGWAAGLGAAGCIALNGPFVDLWVGRQFFAGAWVTSLIAISITWAAIETAASGTAFAVGHIRESSTLAVSEPVARAIAMVLLFNNGMGIMSAPVAALAAAGLVGLPLTIRIIRMSFHTSNRCAAGIFGRLGGQFASLIGVALLWRLCVPAPASWLAFLGQVVGLGICEVLALAALSSEFRNELRVMALVIQGRLRPLAT